MLKLSYFKLTRNLALLTLATALSLLQVSSAGLQDKDLTEENIRTVSF